MLGREINDQGGVDADVGPIQPRAEQPGHHESHGQNRRRGVRDQQRDMRLMVDNVRLESHRDGEDEKGEEAPDDGPQLVTPLDLQDHSVDVAAARVDCYHWGDCLGILIP
ncbi:hypothetical protein VQ044_05565 [Aurantimonas sp. C2-5-R2]|uniref:hypothetical protein n=1 Tax=unclassified Aurantimonas TaxID=2638230 RepID=UPI002E18F48D|nr:MULTISPECIES: hypothetical protein [unclassified Aurantimonas]MEC5289901.1 hypothetical protein [Aurantimonas sp. C2-3-R2]MEC5410983.1 hypothetical protein [Aurantimonas sp. C2-4-R8]